jgi:hypothetical protein
MRDIPFVFFLAAVLCVMTGMSLGIWMGIAQQFQFAPVHAHLNLVGWATMALFAIYYRLTPQAAQGWLPRVHAVLAIVGIIGMASGLAGEIAGHEEFMPALLAGSLLTAASMLLFLFTVVRYGFGSAPARSGRMARDVAMTPAE